MCLVMLGSHLFGLILPSAAPKYTLPGSQPTFTPPMPRLSCDYAASSPFALSFRLITQRTVTATLSILHHPSPI